MGLKISDRRSVSIESTVIFVFSIIALSLFKVLLGDHRISGVYFHIWPSDSMIETLPSSLLRTYPLESLFYLHIEPPLLDGVRAVILDFFNEGSGITASEFLDGKMYWVLTLFYGALSALVYLWVRIATNSKSIASVSSLAWILYPSPIFFSTFLDATLIGTVFITWMIFEIWLFYQGKGSTVRLLTAAILCFLTRTFFQWYFFPILLISLLFIGVRRRVFFQSLIVLLLVVGGYSAKQYYLYGTFGTTTFASEHLTGMLWIESANPSGGLTWTGKETEEHLDLIQTYARDNPKTYPENAVKFGGGYNTKLQWDRSYAHSRIAREYCEKEPYSCVGGVWRSFLTNWPEYWRVESWTKSVLTDAYPEWLKKQYYRVSTRAEFLLIIAGICFFVLARRSKWTWRWWIRSMALVLVPGFLFGICILGNRFDWYEGGRMRFFLEPVFFVFVVSQLYNFSVRLLQRQSATDS